MDLLGFYAQQQCLVDAFFVCLGPYNFGYYSKNHKKLGTVLKMRDISERDVFWAWVMAVNRNLLQWRLRSVLLHYGKPNRQSSKNKPTLDYGVPFVGKEEIFCFWSW